MAWERLKHVCMGHVMLGLDYCSSLDQELMDLMRSWVDIEEGRGKRSAHCVVMDVRALVLLECPVIWYSKK